VAEAVTLAAMSERTQHRHTVHLEVFQLNELAVLDHVLYRAPVGDPIRRPVARRRVLIHHPGPLSPAQLLALAVRMGGFVLSGARGTALVPRGLPWREVGATEWSVPPGGGEGGANPVPLPRDRSGREYPLIPSERLIP
jgi:hypothetical protein